MKPDPKFIDSGNGVSDPTGFVDSVVTLAERLLELGVEGALLMDGFDDCVAGILERYGMEPIILYDKDLVIQKLMDEGCDSYEDAVEYYEFNQLGGWHGNQTPGFLVKLPTWP